MTVKFTKKEKDNMAAVLNLAKCNIAQCEKQLNSFFDHSFKNSVPKMTHAINNRDEKQLIDVCQKSNSSKQTKDLIECSLSKCNKQYRKHTTNEAKNAKLPPPPKKITLEYAQKVNNAKCVNASKAIIQKKMK
jgi:hypothetical protein